LVSGQRRWVGGANPIYSPDRFRTAIEAQRGRTVGPNRIGRLRKAPVPKDAGESLLSTLFLLLSSAQRRLPPARPKSHAMPLILARSFLAAVACLMALAAAAPARATPDHASALHVFNEARTLCERDNGALWGQSLCGPIMIVDPADRNVIANQLDAGGVLVAKDGVFTGTLPPATLIANTRLEWSGTQWTQLAQAAGIKAE